MPYYNFSPSRRNSTVHTPLLLPIFPARPAKQPLPREIRTSHQVYPLKLHGYIYTTIFALHGAIRHGRYIFMRSSTSFGHRRSSAPTTYIYIYIYYIYIFFYEVISTLERHGTATVGEARAPQVQGPSAMLFFVFCFLFFVFCFSSHGRFEQGLKWSKEPHQLPY